MTGHSVDASLEGGVDLTVVTGGDIGMLVEPAVTHVEVTVAVPGIQGPPGPAGAPGEQGPPGPEGGAYQRDVVFAVPALVWEASHTLVRQPNVTCRDTSGEVVEGDPSFPDAATVRVTWAVPMAGTLRLT
ncbi:hypothetical protein [Nonomuraea dietziae]|uniref:hypothetical protein n=1 Tax=Nonomuraea dietziae TaxID=65515 RepID=UPI0033DC4C2E